MGVALGAVGTAEAAGVREQGLATRDHLPLTSRSPRPSLRWSLRSELRERERERTQEQEQATTRTSAAGD